MLSRRQFFTITIIMLVLVVLFQFTGVLKDRWNEYDKNKYAESASSEITAADAFRSGKSDANIQGEYVVLIGEESETAIGKMANAWCAYTKQDLFSYTSLNEVSWNVLTQSRLVLIDSNYIDFGKETAMLRQAVEQGASLVFCNLPDVEVIDGNRQLQLLLGIHTVLREEITLEGVELFGDFLLGGTAIYQAETEEDEKRQDMDLTVPWYSVYANTKTYMMGLLDKDDFGGEDALKNETLPSIIWRNSIGEQEVFVVNGDYMEGVTALGILSAMVYEMQEYSLYPVVNAQSFSVVNFAGLSSEEDDTMQEFYSRTQKTAFQDLFWPSLVSIYSQSGDKPTFILNPKLDYDSEEQPDGKHLVYYMKLIQEAGGENGLCFYQNSNLRLTKKLEEDLSFYNKYIPDYQFRALYVDKNNETNFRSVMLAKSLEKIKTVYMGVNDTDSPVTFVKSDTTKQRASHNGFEHTYRDNLKLRSLETGLGYSNIVVDMGKIVNPSSKKEGWEIMAEKLASNTITFWKPFHTFDKTVLSESDQRIRRFLALEYEDECKDNEITLQIQHLEEEAFFVLRTHNESIKEVTGGTYEEIENHAYLITATEKTVKISLEEDVTLEYEYVTE